MSSSNTKQSSSYKDHEKTKKIKENIPIYNRNENVDYKVENERNVSDQYMYPNYPTVGVYNETYDLAKEQLELENETNAKTRNEYNVNEKKKKKKKKKKKNEKKKQMEMEMEMKMELKMEMEMQTFVDTAPTNNDINNDNIVDINDVSGKEEMTDTFVRLNSRKDSSTKKEDNEIENDQYTFDIYTKECSDERESKTLSDSHQKNNCFENEKKDKETSRKETEDILLHEMETVSTNSYCNKEESKKSHKKKKLKKLKTKGYKSEANLSDQLEQLKYILIEQMEKKNLSLNEKLRKRQSERSKLEEDVNRIGLELYRINKEYENLEKKEKELMICIQNLHKRKENCLNEKKELENSYSINFSNYKKELNYFADLFNKYNSALLDANNVKIYWDFLNKKTKISENVASSDKQIIADSKKVNKKENIINKLNHEISKTQNTINVNEEFCKNHEKENITLEKSVQEEKKELTALQKEQRQIAKQINDSINQMKKRDTVIQEISNKTEELKQNIILLEKDNKQKEEEVVVTNEKKEKLLSDLKYLKQEIQKMNDKKEEADKNILEIAKSNEQLKTNIFKEQEKYKQLCNEIKSINKDIQHKENDIRTVKQDINKSIDSLLNIYINQIRINTFSARIKKDASSVKENIAKKETEIENYKNAIIRMKIQNMLEDGKIENTRKKLEKLKNVYKENNDTLSYLEGVVAKNHHLIEIKQVDVDRLNKEYGKKSKATNEMNNAPLTLDIKIQKLNKHIDKILAECRSLEKEWFLKQSELVKTQNENLKVHDEIMKSKDICVILNQKKCELQENLKNEELMKNKKNKNIGHIRLQLEKFSIKTNETIEKIKFLESDMLKWAENIKVKTETDKRKKEQLKNEINELKKEKMQCQQELLDYENKILILENKIIEEKKLQELIKEYSENKDIILLQKQIQQKNNFIETLKKQQNGILANVKLALHKRNDLDDEKEMVQKNYDSGVNISSKIQYEISVIKKTFVSNRNMKEKLHKQLNELKSIHNELVCETKQQILCINNLKEECHICDGIIEIQKAEKKHRFQELLKFQRAQKNFNFYENLKISYTDIKENCSNYKKKISLIINKLEQFTNLNKKYIRCISILKEWLLH